MSNVRPHSAAIEDWASGPDAKRLLADLGEQIVADARAAAPRETGAGAESIEYEVVDGPDGAYVRVSWDRDHDYMRFPELGTSETPARPFLRPAAEKRRNL